MPRRKAPGSLETLLPSGGRVAERGSHACSVPAGPLEGPPGACAGLNGCPDAEALALPRLPLRKRGRRKREQVVDFGLGTNGFLRAIRTQKRTSRHRGDGRGAGTLPRTPSCPRGGRGAGREAADSRAEKSPGPGP